MKEFSLNKVLLFSSLIGWTLFNVASVVQPASNKIIRVALHKGIAMKSGTFGQPVTSYYARLDVGTPPKIFNMSIDIGASENWLPHYSMLGGILFNRLHYKRGYAKKSSSTSVKDNTGFKFEHMQCDLEGKPYEDLFEFKDVIEGLHRAMIRQRFLAVSSASNDKLADLASDGVLAFSGLPMSAAKSRAPLLNMVQAKLIDEPVFSLWLNAEDPSSTDGGELTLGGVNPARYLGVMIKHRVAPSSGTSSWSLTLSGVQLGATFVSCYHKGCVATLATATNDIVGPIDDVLRIMDALRSLKGGNIKIEPSSSDKSLHEIDCLMVADLPPLTFVIDDTPYQIQAADYVRHKAGRLNLADIKRGFFTPDTCYIAILPGSSTKEWILGSNFLANYYTSYDYTRREVGIAAKTVSGTRT